MDFDKIMREITAGLTDDPKQNMIYLREQSRSRSTTEGITGSVLRAVLPLDITDVMLAVSGSENRVVCRVPSR